MERYGSPYLGLDTKSFWEQMERCFAPVLAEGVESKSELDIGLIPEIQLDPPPASWPDPAEFEEPAD